MNPVDRLGQLLDCAPLLAYGDRTLWFSERDTIKRILWEHLATRPTAHWLAILEPADVWCAEILDWPRLIEHEGFKALDMIQEVKTGSGATLVTTRCPIRIDGKIITSPRGAPKIGEHTEVIRAHYKTREALL